MSDHDHAWSFATRAIHSGQEPDPATGAVTVPIYQTSTFTRIDPDGHQPFVYSRRANPTRSALESCLASLDGGVRALAFSSGMAATTAAANLLKPGDTALLVEDCYGGTRQLYSRVLVEREVKTLWVDATDLDAVRRALAAAPKLVWLESPTNPLLRIVDLPAVADLAHAAGALVAVDNTLASPYLQRPLELGADIVHYSTTKYHGGHSDLLGGALIVQDAALGERLAYYQYITGGVPGPLDAWLVLRGIKTMVLRMEQHCQNALHLALALERHPAVASVRYPGLESHPQHQLAQRQMRRFGGILSFELHGGRRAGLHVCNTVRLYGFAPSVGGVESLITHPASVMFSSFTAEQRATIGITDGLVRVSAGIEDITDLTRDLLHALDTIPS